MGFSFWHIMVVVLLIVLLFGRGKISDLMGDMARGIKSFKKGLADDEDAVAVTHHETIEAKAEPAVRKDEAAKG